MKIELLGNWQKQEMEALAQEVAHAVHDGFVTNSVWDEAFKATNITVTPVTDTAATVLIYSTIKDGTRMDANVATMDRIIRQIEPAIENLSITHTEKEIFASGLVKVSYE